MDNGAITNLVPHNYENNSIPGDSLCVLNKKQVYDGQVPWNPLSEPLTAPVNPTFDNLYTDCKTQSSYEDNCSNVQALNDDGTPKVDENGDPVNYKDCVEYAKELDCRSGLQEYY